MIPSKNGMPLPPSRLVDVDRFLKLYPHTSPRAQAIFREIFEYYYKGNVQYFPHSEWLPFNLRTRFHPIGNTSELAAVHLASFDGDVEYATDRDTQVEFDSDFLWKEHKWKCSVKTGIVDKNNYLVYGLPMHSGILNSKSDCIWFMDNEIQEHVCIETRSLQKNMIHCMLLSRQKKVILPLERVKVITQGKYLQAV